MSNILRRFNLEV